MTCIACGMNRSAAEFEIDICQHCERALPESLVKAMMDTFSYALKLRNGDVFEFESASYSGGEFVRIVLPYPRVRKDEFLFQRGVDIRLSDIIWCADAPHGS